MQTLQVSSYGWCTSHRQVALTAPCARLGGQEAVVLDPGDSIIVQDLPWAEGGWLSADLIVEAEVMAVLQIEVFARRADGTGPEKTARWKGDTGLFPDLAHRWMLNLAHVDGQTLFLPRHAGGLKTTCFGTGVQLNEIHHLRLTLKDVNHRQQLRLGALKHQPTRPEPWVEDKCITDELGQWHGRRWPGKTPSVEAMRTRLEAELTQSAPQWPEQWSRFGGSKAHPFKATGRFRVEHDGERWWLVDPEGYGFWSAGIDCVGPRVQSAVVPGTEKLYQFLPVGQAEFEKAWNAKGTWDIPTADLGVANLIRVFGEGWWEQWSKLMVRRMKAWRFNTIANWSDLRFARQSGVPYVMPMAGYPTTATRLFRDFPDVMSQEFADAATKWAEYLRPMANDPMLIGYFMTNEPQWGFGAFNLAAEMLERNPGTETRKALARFIAQRYRNNASGWKLAWNVGSEIIGFEDLVNRDWHRIAEHSKTAAEDLWEFGKEMVRAYVRIPAQACRAVDSGHLNLGTRWAWIASDLCYEGSEFVDAFSINCYQMTPDAKIVDEIAKRTGKPVMIGEFHMGALDRGLPANGLRGVPSQEQRGIAYRYYIEQGAANPNLIGAHYFLLYDEAVLGRFDGENWQIGLVDVCHQPYEEVLRAAAMTHERMYAVRDGSIEPFGTPAQEVERIAI